MTMQMSAGRDTGTGKKRTEKTGNFLPKRAAKEENYQLRGNTDIFLVCPGTRDVCCVRLQNRTKKQHKLH